MEDDIIGSARQALEAARRRVSQEISTYPGPVSGCDAQFNHLLAVRQRLANAAASLDRDVRIPTSREP
jgi:hypothetical protein